MNDRALVAALGAGDPAGLDGAYRAYADRVYAYCRWLLVNRDAAADALVDTFVVASVRSGRLRHPERLRAWLYAVARSQCRWHAHAGHRGPSGWIEQDPRELVELVDRHGLPIAEAGLVVGVPSHRVRELLAEARSGRSPEAAGLADAATAEYAGEPFPPVPDLLWPRLQLRALDPGLGPEREAALRRVGRPGPTGFPRPWRARRRRRVLLVAGLVAGALAVGGGGAAAVTTAAPPPPTPPAALTPTPVAAPTSAPVPTPTPSPTPSPSPSPSPTFSPTPTPTPSPTTPPEPTAEPLSVTATAEVDCAFWWGDVHRLEVTATASEPLEEAELHLSGRRRDLSFTMEIDGDTATFRTDWIEGRYDWWVEVETGSATAESDPVEVRDPCEDDDD